MGKKGNSGFSGVDKRFGMGGLNVKGNIDRHQNYLERLDGRLSPIGVFPTPTMWLDANSDNITTVTYAGDERVETWSDKSGNGIDASNFGSDVQKPFYDPTDSEFNDLPAVDFSTNDFLVTADDNKLDVNSTGGFTVYVVFNYDSSPSTYFNFLISRTNGTSWTEGWGIYFYEPFSGTDEIRFFVIVFNRFFCVCALLQVELLAELYARGAVKRSHMGRLSIHAHLPRLHAQGQLERHADHTLLLPFRSRG